MSCCDTLIISLATVREKCGLSANVEDRKLKPFLEEAQLEVQKILRETLYADLIARIVADPTLSGVGDEKYKDLVDDYLCPLLSFRTYQYSIPFLAAEPDRNGIMVKSGDDYSPADSRLVTNLGHAAEERADKHQERLLTFLQDDNGTLFPGWLTITDTDTPITKTYRGGVITRRSRWQTPYGDDRRGWVDPNQMNCDEC